MSEGRVLGTVVAQPQISNLNLQTTFAQSHSIVITTSPLVLPGTSNGCPARMMIRSPGLAIPSSVQTREASETAPLVSWGVSSSDAA